MYSDIECSVTMPFPFADCCWRLKEGAVEAVRVVPFSCQDSHCLPHRPLSLVDPRIRAIVLSPRG